VTRMQAAYVSVQQVRELVGRLGAGARPLRLVATGTNGAGDQAGRTRSASLAERLKEQVRRIK
ncbi:MAG: hypothetical protein GWN58_11950, partial [Anaerolineae bacterium]|nr:hypothetical protein [Anaerolineae bacterium]